MFCVVVDDSEEYGAIIRGVLRRNFAEEVHIETNFFAAYRYLVDLVSKQRYPDIIFIDYDLRDGRNGLDLIQDCKRLNDLSSYVLITNSDDEEIVNKAIQLGALHVHKSGDLDRELIKVSLHAISQLTKQRAAALSETVKQRRRVFELSTELAHEMLSITQAITQCGELMQLRATDEGFWDSVHDLVERIDEKVDEADLMCSVLRSYGILEKSALNPEMTLIAKCVDPLETDLNIDISFEGDIADLRFLLDRAAFSRIFTNLVKNFDEHCGRSARLQIIITIKQTATSDLLVIDLLDDGPGIPKEYWKAIFEAGDRAGKDLDYQDGGGLGLGLSISKSLALSHKYGEISGDLELVDSTSAGSHFRLSLPGEIE